MGFFFLLESAALQQHLFSDKGFWEHDRTRKVRSVASANCLRLCSLIFLAELSFE